MSIKSQARYAIVRGMSQAHTLSQHRNTAPSEREVADTIITALDAAGFKIVRKNPNKPNKK